MAKKLSKAQKERRRRQRISRSLKRYHRTGVTAWERKWGKKVAGEQKRERRKVVKKIPLELSPLERAIAYLDRLATHAPGDTQVDSKVHADGSLDAELRVAVPRGMDGKDLTFDLEPFMVLPPSYWVAFGWIFAKGTMTDEEIEQYDRFHRMLQVHTHYRRVLRSKVQSALHGSRNIYEALEENKRRKPLFFYVRLHWSPDGSKPT